MKQLYQKSHDRVKLDVKPVNITVYNIYFVTTAVLSLVLNFALYILVPRRKPVLQQRTCTLYLNTIIAEI